MSRRLPIAAGERFGRLTTLRKPDGKHWLCRCDCGAVSKVQCSRLRSGRTKSCGCLARDHAKNLSRSRMVDITHQYFGRLFVLGLSGNGNQWQCVCECGEMTLTTSHHLRTGHVKSCGCLRTSVNQKLARKRMIPIPIGSEFGALTVVAQDGGAWRCRCECGREVSLPGNVLRVGQRRSCGCRITQRPKDVDSK